MGLRWTSGLLVGGLVFACTHTSLRADGGPPVQGQESSSRRTEAALARETLWLIPHTHWEGAVFKTRAEYLEIGLPHILTALELLKAYPEYRFVLDQVAYVKPFLERYPQQEAAFRKFVSEGRLQIVGGNDVMLDVNIPSGESWVRQVLYGKGYYREKLGVDVTVGWGLDTFGHHAQMPQLLKLGGYQSYWFQRGVHAGDTPSEFFWEGIDGSRIPAFWLPLGYGLFYPAPQSASEFESYTRQEWEALGRYSRWPDRVALAGADVSEPEESLPVRVHEFDQKGRASFALRFGVPTDFEKIAGQRADRPVVTGELNPVFQGVYSSRIELKQWVRTLERTLTTAEVLSTLASWLGKPAQKEDFARAWEPVLFNQAHDLMSGTMVDKVYEDTLRGYQFSKNLGDELIAKSLDAITSRIDTSGEGVPLVVFNNLGWQRTELAEADVGLSEPGTRTLKLLDPSGQIVPIQYLEAQRYEDGGIKHAKFAFIARDVPAFGYSLYRVASDRTPSVPGEPTSPHGNHSSSTLHEDFGSIENEYYRATFDLWTGEMTKLWVKSGGWDALGNGAANVIAREQDGGDFWELYGTLSR